MRTLALIAHDNRKVDLVAWATFNRETLTRFSLVGTRHTARLIQSKVGLPVGSGTPVARVAPLGANQYGLSFHSDTGRWEKMPFGW